MNMHDVDASAPAGAMPATVALTIAGSDSGGGAGVQADARVMRLRGVHACTVITALTAQNTRGVQAMETVGGGMIEAQLLAVLEDFPVAAIKTGLLPNAETVRLIARILREHPGMPLVVDPVLASTGGRTFLDDAGIEALCEELLPLASLITPNLGELARLTGMPTSQPALVCQAAETLWLRTGAAILAKGGHAEGAACDDLLLLADGSLAVLEGKRIQTPNTHGTGCSLSAGIAAGLALGLSLQDSVSEARAQLRESLQANAQVRWGGCGPAMP